MKRVNVTNTVFEVESCFNGMRWKQIIGDQEENETEGNPILATEFYDRDEMDINRMKLTDLPFNSKVCMPRAIGMEKEVKF